MLKLILTESDYLAMLPTISNECDQFLKESIGYPLLKNLPKNNDGFRKVKVRKKNYTEKVIDVFNETFKDDHSQILQRSIFAHGEPSFKPIDNEFLEPFYVFPINGYKYMYADNVVSTTESYKETLDLLVDGLGDKAIETFKEVLKYQYKYDKLYEGLMGNSEIIIYNVPYYYAIRVSLIDDYSVFLIS